MLRGSLRRSSGTAGSEESGGWFQWFYHRDQKLEGHPFDVSALADAASRAAASLGLEVFGGDAIATRDGRILVIDLNAWPSFALFRDEAGPTIGAYLAARFAIGLKNGSINNALGDYPWVWLDK